MCERYWHILKGNVPNMYIRNLIHIGVEYATLDLIKNGNSIAFTNTIVAPNYDDEVYGGILVRLLKNITDEDRTYLTLLGLELKEEVRPKYLTLLENVLSSNKPYYAKHTDFRKLYYRSEMDRE